MRKMVSRNYPRSLIAVGVLMILGTISFVLNGLLTTISHSSESGKNFIPTKNFSVSLSFSLNEFAQNAISGGPGKDGIPAIDKPQFVSVKEANRFLDSDDVVFGVNFNDQIKAYPQKILVWHEIVNDRLGDENVSVTYCPLTGTAIGFIRGTTTLGVSGNLVNSNLIMYDRATDSRWPQILGTAVSGSLKGQSLKEFRVFWTTWQRWKTVYPETVVLSRDTGYLRNYNRDPYGSYNPRTGYYQPERPPIFPVLYQSAQFDPKIVVIGARNEDGAIAFNKEALRNKKILYGENNGIWYTAVYDTQLDSAYIYRNPEKKSLVYRAGDIMYEGMARKVDNIPLTQVNAFDAMWFAWVAFYPETSVYD